MLSKVKPPPSSTMKLALIAIAVLFILTSAVIGALFFEQNRQQTALATTTTALSQNHNATATALSQNATATAIVAPTATAIAFTAYPSYMSGSGTFAFYDPLQKAQIWKPFIDEDDHSSCQYQNDGLHVQTDEQAYYFVCGEKNIYKDFAFEVQMTMLKGDCGGLGIRYNAKQGSSYSVFICQDGGVVLQRNESFQTKDEYVLARVDAKSAINTGYGQSNRIAALVKGGSITVYINGTQVMTVND